MELIFDDKTGTWGEAPKVYGTIECTTKEDYEFVLNVIKTYKQLEAKIKALEEEIERLHEQIARNSEEENE